MEIGINNTQMFADHFTPTTYISLDDYPKGDKPGTRVIKLDDGSKCEVNENILRAAIEEYNHEWKKYKEERWINERRIEVVQDISESISFEMLS